MVAKILRREVEDNCPVMSLFAALTVVACSEAEALLDQTVANPQFPSMMSFCDLPERLVCQFDDLHVRES
jgi:hypothetical protein